MTEYNNPLLDKFLSENPNSKLFFDEYIKPLIGDTSTLRVGCRSSRENLDLYINDIQWCLIMKNSSVQILPHGMETKAKIAHITAHPSIYDIRDFLKSKKKKKYYISVIYKNMAGFDESIRKMLSDSFTFINNLG